MKFKFFRLDPNSNIAQLAGAVEYTDWNYIIYA